MAKVRIAVLGAGRIGSTLGRKWIAAQHRVVFGVTDPDGEKARALRADLGDQADIRPGAQAIQGAEVVVFAVPGGAMEAVIAANAAALGGKLVIDAANRMTESAPNSRVSFQRHAPSARYVRAFNSLGVENFADPTFNGVKADLFYAGPETDRAVAEQLIGDIGLEPMYVGNEDQVGLVDAAASLWFALALGQKRGRHLAFKVLAS